ncbi:MAG: ABC transporter substrate-binding protein [Stellaceae bacterium]
MVERGRGRRRLSLRGMTVLALAASMAAGGWANGAFAAEKQQVHVSMAAQTVIYAPYLIAIEKGYYAGEGLEIEVKIAGGGVATPAQLSGSIDINTSGPVALSPILRCAAMKIVTQRPRTRCINCGPPHARSRHSRI